MSEKDFEEKINRLSMMEQNAQYISQQRQTFQNQMIEIDSALNELKTSTEAFKIIGAVMVKIDRKKVESELNKKKELIDVRIKSIEKQEKQMKEKSEKLRDEVLKSLSSEKQQKKGD